MQNPRLLPDTNAALRDELLSVLIGLARAAYSKPKDEQTTAILIESLALSAECTDETALSDCIRRLTAEKLRVAPDCAVCPSPCGSTSNYDMQLLWNAPEDVRAAKLWVLFALQGMAVRLQSENASPSSAFSDFLFPAISLLAEDLTAAEIQPYALKILRAAF